MKLSRILFIFVLILGVEWRQAYASEDMGCKAIVKTGAMDFSFPIPPKDVFEWYQDKTKDNCMEYAWNVSLKIKGDDYYKFGVYLFKYPGAKSIKGSLEKLISICQTSFWDPNGATIDHMKIQSVVIEKDRLLIHITDKATIRKLMANKPKEAYFQVVTPYEELNFRAINKLETK
jgi:hypothetical protein